MLSRKLQGAGGTIGGAAATWTDPDLANASYDSVSFSVSAQEGTPEGIFFKPDGTKMYVVGRAGDEVNEYDLSTAWDISTASYLQNFSVATQETSPTGLFFKPDGTKMYVTGYNNDAVYEYDLSTAWNISTASYLQNFSVATQETFPYDLFFKPDGTKMYIVGNGRDVNEYDLSTAWDISTTSYLQNFNFDSVFLTVPRGIFFNPDGTKLYIISEYDDEVNEFNLSIAWNVSTCTYVQNFSVLSQDGGSQGLFFKSDGSKMYMIGNVNDAVYQYSTN